jgi:hypothetical protein
MVDAMSHALWFYMYFGMMNRLYMTSEPKGCLKASLAANMHATVTIWIVSTSVKGVGAGWGMCKNSPANVNVSSSHLASKLYALGEDAVVNVEIGRIRSR